MQRGMIDEVVGVDSGVTIPVERGQVGKSAGRQKDYTLDSSGVKYGVEPFDAHALRADNETFDIETQLARAFRDSSEERGVVADCNFRADVFHQFHGSEHAPELLGTRSAQLRHDRTGEWIAFVPGGLCRGPDALCRGCLDP